MKVNEMSTRELIKECIDYSAEIARFLLEANKRPKMLEEMSETELNAIFEKHTFLGMCLFPLTQSARQKYERDLKHKKERQIKGEIEKRSGK